MDEENAEEEKKILENGPLLTHAYNIQKKAMKYYWKKMNLGNGNLCGKSLRVYLYIVKVLLFWLTLYQISSFFGVN